MYIYNIYSFCPQGNTKFLIYVSKIKLKPQHLNWAWCNNIWLMILLLDGNKPVRSWCIYVRSVLLTEWNSRPNEMKTSQSFFDSENAVSQMPSPPKSLWDRRLFQVTIASFSEKIKIMWRKLPQNRKNCVEANSPVWYEVKLSRHKLQDPHAI